MKDQIEERIEGFKGKTKEITGKILDDAGMKPGKMALKKKYLTGLAIVFYLMAWAGGAEASMGPLAGKDMQLENSYETGVYPGTLVNFTVPESGTIQFYWAGTGSGRPAPIIVDVSDTGPNTAIATLTETMPTSGNYAPSPNLALFSAISQSIPTFTNVTLDASTTTAFFDPSRVQYTGTTFSYDFGGLPIVNGGFIKLNITTVPVPGAVWLFGSSLLALMGFKRRGNIR